MKEEIEEILNKYIKEEENLNLILDDIQERYGCIPIIAQNEVSDYLNVPKAKVYATIKIYPKYSFQKEGKYKITICTGKECLNKSRYILIEELKELLKIEYGETTKDGLFTLEKVNCLRQCSKGPNIMINNSVYNNMTKEKLKKVINDIVDTERNNGK